MDSSPYAHRVVFIPELLELVFRQLDVASNASNACVCKLWSQIALDALWRDVDNAYHLFSILAPMTRSTRKWTFERSLQPNDWSRFSQYARRVRKFCYDDSYKDAVHVAAFEEVAQMRTTLSVLPNLRELTWITDNVQRRFSVLFMNKSVKSFTFVLDYAESFSHSSFFGEIVSRMPFLTNLDMRIAKTGRCGESDILKLITGLPKLQKVVVPLYYLTSKVIEALSKLENLGTIQFEFIVSQGRGEREDLRVFNPVLAEGAFPSLWDISLSLHLAHFITFIKGPFAPSNLSSIYIHAISVDGESAVHQFFSAVADQCPLLEQFFLECLPGPTLSTQWNMPISQFERLTLSTFKPLFACRRLTTFELIYPSPLLLTMDDLEELTTKWSALECILLNAEPVLEAGVRSDLTLQAILPFVRNCPDLRKLGLFINATAADIPSPAEIPPPFTKLVELRVGVSSIAECGPVALFLSRICPLGCSILSGVSWPDVVSRFPVTMEEIRIIRKWCDLWLEVDRFLPLLTKLRMEERETRSKLQEEVDDLRTRNKIMTEKAQLALSGDPDDSCLIT